MLKKISFRNLIGFSIFFIFFLSLVILFAVFNDFNKKNTKQKFIDENGYAAKVASDYIENKKEELLVSARRMAYNPMVFYALRYGKNIMPPSASVQKMISGREEELTEDNIKIREMNKLSYYQLVNVEMDMVYGSYDGSAGKGVEMIDSKGNVLAASKFYPKEFIDTGKEEYILNGIGDRKKSVNGYGSDAKFIQCIDERFFMKSVLPVARGAAGVFVAGELIDDKLLAEIKKTINKDVLLMKGNKVISSTIYKDGISFKNTELSISLKNTLKDSYKEISINGERMGFAFFPLFDYYKNEIGYMGVGFNLKEIDIIYMKSFKSFTIFAAIFSLFFFVIIYFSLSTLFRPFTSITKAINSISRGDYGQKIAVKIGKELVVVAEDITTMSETIEKRERDLRTLNRELDEKNKKLLEFDKLKDQFLANTSHELRTPLNGIIGIADSLIEGVAGAVNRKMIENLTMIVASGKRLSKLIDDILDYSLLREKEVPLTNKTLNLKQVTDIVVFLTKPLVRNKNIVIINDIDEKSSNIFADENRLEQILYNLIGNAIKFTNEGSVRITSKEKGEFIEVTIADTGIGIAKENFGNLFKSFEQIDGSAIRERGGTGLGLAITKKIVEHHGGKIWLESDLGIGTKVMFTLKRSNEEVSAQLENRFENIVKENEEIYDLSITIEEHSENKEFTILIADDETVNLQVMVNILSEKYNVILAYNGYEVMEKIDEDYEAERKIDIVIVDVMMPKMSGYEVARYIRERYTSFEMPILMLSAKNRSIDLLTGLDAGANDYVTKPFDKKEVLARVNNLIYLKKAVRDALDRRRQYEDERRLREVTEKLSNELKDKNDALNRSIEELKMTQKQLIVSEKMAAMGGLIAGIAHEINTPVGICLTAVSYFSEQTTGIKDSFENKKITNTDLRGYLYSANEIGNLIITNLKRTNNLITSFKQISGDYFVDEKREFELKDYIAIILESLYAELKKSKHTASIESNSRIVLNSYPSAFSQIITNLVLNSIVHGFENIEAGKIVITITKIENILTITYKDNGKGIESVEMKRIFEPFYTTKRGSGRPGLGLHTVFNLVTTLLKGEIECRSVVNEYTEFEISIPLSNENLVTFEKMEEKTEVIHYFLDKKEEN